MKSLNMNVLKTISNCYKIWLRIILRQYFRRNVSFQMQISHDITPFQEPPCRICTRLARPTSELHSLQGRYKSSVTRRREYCEPSRCHAKVDTDLKSGFDSRYHNAGRVVNKIQELKRNVQDVEELKRHDKTVINIIRNRMKIV